MARSPSLSRVAAARCGLCLHLYLYLSSPLLIAHNPNHFARYGELVLRSHPDFSRWAILNAAGDYEMGDRLTRTRLTSDDRLTRDQHIDQQTNATRTRQQQAHEDIPGHRPRCH